MVTLVNRAKMTTATTGDGTITLGSAVSGFQTFASAGVVNEDVVSYVIEDGSAWEVGTGTYTSSGTTLSRTLVESSTDNLLNLSGDAVVYVTIAAADVAQIDDVETATINEETGTSYTLVASDRGQVVTMANGGANTVTIPASGFNVGDVVTVIQIGSGTTTITAASGVDINGLSAGSVAIYAQYQGVSLLKITSTSWVAMGAV